MKTKIAREVYLWGPVVVWALLIFRFSSGRVPVASPVFWQDFAVKKTGHVLLFGILAIFLYRALRGEGVSRKRAVVWAIVLATFYGATDEFHQVFTQGREARVRDIVVDFVGAGVFVCIAYQFLPKLPKKFKIYAEELGLI